MKLTFIIKAVISFAILLILFTNIEINQVLRVIASFSLPLILLALSVILFSLVLGAFTFKILLHPLRTKISFGKIFHYSIISWSAGLFVPGKIGELSLIPLLKKEGVSLGEASAITLLDKVITLIVLSFFSIIGFFLFLEEQTTLFLSALLIISILIIFFLMMNQTFQNFLKKKLLKKFSKELEDFYKHTSLFFKKEKTLLLLNFIVTFLKWYLISLIFYIFFISLNQDISLFSVFLINSILIIITLIPISIGGLGVRESAAVLLYSKMSIPPELTLGIHILMVVITYLVGGIILLLSLQTLNFRK
jgi:glycosyltransferase 2 family protein